MLLGSRLIPRNEAHYRRPDSSRLAVVEAQHDNPKIATDRWHRHCVPETVMRSMGAVVSGDDGNPGNHHLARSKRRRLQRPSEFYALSIVSRVQTKAIAVDRRVD